MAVGEEVGADLAAGAGEMVEGVEIDVTGQDGDDTVGISVSRMFQPIIHLESSAVGGETRTGNILEPPRRCSG